MPSDFRESWLKHVPTKQRRPERTGQPRDNEIHTERRCSARGATSPYKLHYDGWFCHPDRALGIVTPSNYLTRVVHDFVTAQCRWLKCFLPHLTGRTLLARSDAPTRSKHRYELHHPGRASRCGDAAILFPDRTGSPVRVSLVVGMIRLNFLARCV